MAANFILNPVFVCTSPITLYKQFKDGSSKEYTVPCGHCAECRAAYQSEFSLLAYLEAEKRGSLHFFTLTYNDSWLPVAWTDYDKSSGLCAEGIGAFYRGSHCYDWQLKEWRENGCSVQTDDDGCSVCPSLFRDDIKNWLKKYRSYCDRQDISKDFSFTCFGEYGERKSRPHYHVLVAGLDDSQANVLSNLWTFGFSLVKSIPRFNKDGSDAFILTSNYVSKYICKQDHLPSFVRDGFAQAPRRQSSIGFGKHLDLDILRPFYLAEDCQHLPKELRYQEIIKRKNTISINGKKFKLPRYAHDAFFHRSVSRYGRSAWTRVSFRRCFRERKIKAVRGETFYRFPIFQREGWRFRSAYRPKVVCRPLPLYSRSLAFERERHFNSTLAELQKSTRSLVKNHSKAFRFISARDALQAFERDAAASFKYSESLRRSTDGQ